METSVWNGMGAPSGWSLCQLPSLGRPCTALCPCSHLPGRQSGLPVPDGLCPWGGHPSGGPGGGGTSPSAHGHTQLQPWEAATCRKMPSGPAVHNRFKPPGRLSQRNP